MANVVLTVPATKKATITEAGYMANALEVTGGRHQITAYDAGATTAPPAWILKINIGGDDIFLPSSAGIGHEIDLGSSGKAIINAMLQAAPVGAAVVQVMSSVSRG
jgi:hypothetical protein